MTDYLFYELLKNIKNRVIEFNISVKEYRANSKHRGKAVQSDLEGKILVITHSIEKGMGLKNIRIGYGKQKIDKLLNYLFYYIDKKYNINSYVFLEAVAVLQKYFEYNNIWGDRENIENIEKKYNKLSQLVGSQNLILSGKFHAGYTVIKASDLENMSRYHFEDFLKLRHSIRDYKDEVIPLSIIEKTVELANMGPSACNRQAAKVYCTRTRDDAKYVDSIITGTTGFKDCIPNFAVITEDRAFFTGAEQFQWYINGGIYVSYFSLALHSLGIGNIIMQWFAFYRTESKLKEFFNISKNEAIIAVIGYGYCSDTVKCLKAQRKSVSDTLIYKK